MNLTSEHLEELIASVVSWIGAHTRDRYIHERRMCSLITRYGVRALTLARESATNKDNCEVALARLAELDITPIMTAKCGDRIAGWSTPHGIETGATKNLIERLRFESKRRKDSWAAHPRKHDADVKLGEWSALQEMAEVLEMENHHA
ncbi:MAG: hypothetical protein WDA27_14295 [Actinomycetota bacterium]